MKKLLDSEHPNLPGMKEVLYDTHDASRKSHAVYKRWGDFCVYVGVGSGSPTRFGAGIAEAIAKQEGSRWPDDLRVFCLEPMGLRNHEDDEDKVNNFEFVEIVYDPNDRNYHCDYVHTECPQGILVAFKALLSETPGQTLEYITPGKGWKLEPWSLISHRA